MSAQGGAQPLIVEGKADGDVFEPNEGQPTFAEAKAAFLAGRVVFLKYADMVDDTDETKAVYGLTITTTDERLLISGNVYYWTVNI